MLGLPLDNTSLCAGSDEEWHTAFQTLEKYAMDTGLTINKNMYPISDHKRLSCLPPIESADPTVHPYTSNSLSMDAYPTLKPY